MSHYTCLRRKPVPLATALLVALLVILPRIASAQTPEFYASSTGRALSQYGMDFWDDRQGLPQNSVQALAQTQDGYMWLGTQEGLVRFDGVRFTVFGRGDAPELSRPYIWALEPARDGGLWVGTEEAGVIYAKNGKYRTYTTSAGLPSNFVVALHEAANGQLWIGTVDSGAARLSNGRITRVRMLGLSVTGFAEDRTGGMHIATMRGLFRVMGDSTVRIPIGPASAPDLPAFAVAAARDTSLWVATPFGVVKVHDGRIVQSLTVADGLPSNEVRELAVDPEGRLWMATSEGIAMYGDGRVTHLGKEPSFGRDAQALEIDHEGSVWVGMGTAGLARLRETPFLPVGATEGLAEDMVMAIRQDRTGDMWVGTVSRGIDRITPKGIVNYRYENGGLTSNVVFSIAEGRDGTIWVGTQFGLNAIRDGRTTKYFVKDGLIAQFVRAVLVDFDGNVWLGTHKGVQRFQPGPPVVYTTKEGLGDNFVLSMLQTRDSAIWVGARSTLTRIHKGKFTRYTRAQGLPDGSVSALYEDAAGALWVATSVGLARLADGKFTSLDRDRGLCDDAVHSVLEDDRERLWLSSNRGIFSITKQEFAEAAAPTGKPMECVLYGRAEGMRSREANGAVNPPAWRARDGRMWYPTIKGVVIVDPKNATLNAAAPAVVIESITAEQQQYDSLPKTLPAGTRRVEIQFTGLSFIAPDKMRFRYRLDGLDEDWNDAGARRTATYTNLKPGNYRFRVMAANAAGVWNDQAASYSFAVLPLFWQTWWFRILAGLAAAALLFAAYRSRVEKLYQRQRGLEGLVVERTRAEARYRDLFENATDAVFVANTDGQFTALNLKAQLLTGYSPDEAGTLNVRDLLPDSAAGNVVYEQWMSGRANANTPVEICAKDGTRIPVEVSTRLMWDDDKITGMQAIARDVRDRSALERQLRQSQKMEAIGQLAGGVAHDFNNLLTVIRGNGEMLMSDGKMADPAMSDVQEILDATDRASALTRQLLAFSRKQITQPRVVDLNELILRLEKMLRRLIGEDVEIKLRLAETSCWILADPGHIEQVLVNLAVNARDAMPRGGTVTISTSHLMIENEPQAPVRAESGRCVVLSVTDTGTGIDPATQSRIFEPFFTTKEPGKGTGLGLSTVYGIVQQAGGQIICRSELGRGTEFRVYLPLTLAAAVPVAATEESRFTVRGNETVLLVEDDDAVRVLTQRLLTRQGYNVLSASNGPDALRIADDHTGPIHLLMTDMVMPDMSGIEVADGVRARRPDVRVLVMSGYTDDEILRRGIHDPDLAFLNKPFSADDLGRAVRDALDREPSASVVPIERGKSRSA